MKAATMMSIHTQNKTLATLAITPAPSTEVLVFAPLILLFPLSSIVVPFDEIDIVNVTQSPKSFHLLIGRRGCRVQG